MSCLGHSLALRADGTPPIVQNENIAAYLKHWCVLPSWSAPTIDSEKKLALLEKFEAPLLGGGLGSMMFQIAMVSSFLYSHHLIFYFKN